MTITDEEITTAAAILRKLDKGYIPREIFYEIAERMVLPTIELALLRQVEGRLEILLTQRPEDDRYWPGQWHIPGSIVRATDTPHTYESVFTRILDDELAGRVQFEGETVHAFTIFQTIARGAEVDQMYVAKASTESEAPEDGKFYPVDELPDALMDQYYDMLPRIIEAFTDRF